MKKKLKYLFAIDKKYYEPMDEVELDKVSYDELMSNLRSPIKKYYIDDIDDMLEDIIKGVVVNDLRLDFDRIKERFSEDDISDFLLYGNEFIAAGGLAITCMTSQKVKYNVYFNYDPI